MDAMRTTRNLFGQSMALDPRANLAQLATMGTPNVQAASLLDDDIARYQNPFTRTSFRTCISRHPKTTRYGTTKSARQSNKSWCVWW